MKKLLSVMLACIIAAVSLCGCSGGGSGGTEDTEETKSKKSGMTCTMSVITNYGGTGEDGRDLESGTFTETFTVKAGDVFRENTSGHWLLNSKDKDNEVIVKIKKVKDDTVTFMLGSVETEVSYGAVTKVNSLFTVCDGINYSYKIVFGDEYVPETEVTAARQDGYKSVVCGEQGFSTLCREEYAAYFENGDGMYIETKYDTGIPYVLIYRVGELPISAEQFIEEVYIAGAMNDYGSDLIGFETYTDYEIAGGKHNACKMNYIIRQGSDEYSIISLRVLAEFRGEYVSFNAKYIEGDEEDTLEALETAIKNFSFGASGAGGNEKPAVTDKPSSDSVPQADGDVSIRPSEAASVKYVKYEDPYGYFTAEIPEGWNVYVGLPQGGEYDLISFPMTIYDPEHPERKAFFALSLVTSMSDIFKQLYAGSVTAENMVSTDYSVEGFFKDYGAYIKNTEWGFSGFTSQGDLGAYYNGKMVSASCNSTYYNIPMSGIFAHGGCQTLDLMQMAVFYDVTMITAAEEDAVDWIPVLSRSLGSVKFTSKFDKERAEQWGNVLSASSYLSAAADETRSMISSSWEARNRSYDIMSQKRSDATLGYERVYDTQTGEIYKAANGFTDVYSGSRYKPVTDDMYSEPVAGYIELK